jgi:hypothetical protein
MPLACSVEHAASLFLRTSQRQALRRENFSSLKGETNEPNNSINMLSMDYHHVMV